MSEENRVTMTDEEIENLAELHGELMNHSTEAVLRDYIRLRRSVLEIAQKLADVRSPRETSKLPWKRREDGMLLDANGEVIGSAEPEDTAHIVDCVKIVSIIRQAGLVSELNVGVTGSASDCK